MITVNGIYNDIEQSTYFTDIGGFRFYFSSPVYLKKFNDRYNSYISNESMKLKNRYGCEIHVDDLFLFRFYTMIEKRGFKVIELSTNKVISKVPLFNLNYVI